MSQKKMIDRQRIPMDDIDDVIDSAQELLNFLINKDIPPVTAQASLGLAWRTICEMMGISKENMSQMMLHLLKTYQPLP